MDDKTLVERWPGYDQQSWQERFVELDRQHQNDRNFLIIPMSNTIEAQATRIEALEAALNKPEIHDWAKGVAFEAAHQRERWGVEHDAGKTPFDWFWLIGYLAQKAADAAVRGDTEKAMHHTISTGAALANWHLALSGVDNSMRPEGGGD